MKCPICKGPLWDKKGRIYEYQYCTNCTISFLNNKWFYGINEDLFYTEYQGFETIKQLIRDSTCKCGKFDKNKHIYGLCKDCYNEQLEREEEEEIKGYSFLNPHELLDIIKDFCSYTDKIYEAFRILHDKINKLEAEVLQNVLEKVKNKGKENLEI